LSWQSFWKRGSFRSGSNMGSSRSSAGVSGTFSASGPLPGVEPAFPGADGKQNANDYARGRFGGSRGEIHVYGDDASTIERRILIDGRGQYPQAV